MYKDKKKQQEANKRAKDRYLAKMKGIPQGIPDEGIPEKVFPELVTPKRKGFADLPKDVQENILRVSNMRIGNVDPDPKLVDEEIGRRTQAALDYQAMYPDRATTVEVVKEPVVCSENS